jgi:hypothetical protein
MKQFWREISYEIHIGYLVVKLWRLNQASISYTLTDCVCHFVRADYNWAYLTAFRCPAEKVSRLLKFLSLIQLGI